MPSVVKPDSESTPAPPKVRKKGKARNKSKSEQSIKPVFSNELRLPPIGSQAHAIAIGEGKSANTEHSKPGARKPTEQGLIAPEDSDAYVEDSDSNDDQDKNHNFEDPLVEIAAGKTDGILKRKKTTDYEGQKGLDEWVMANSRFV